MSPRALGNLERGRSRPRPDTLRLLAAALALGPDERAALMAAARDGSSSSPPSPVWASLIGREDILGEVQQLLLAKGPPILLLAGEPGIGKTRLLQEAAVQAVRTGWSVLAGGCRRGGTEPYAPILQALRGYLQGEASADLRHSLDGCRWLVQLLPELADALPELAVVRGLPPEHQQRLLYQAIARYLGNVAGSAGSLLLLDDVHWAGKDACDLLAALVRESTPLRVIAAYRDTELRPDHPLAIVLADLAHAGLVRQRVLRPLKQEEATQLFDQLLGAASMLSSEVLRHIIRSAGGVPFYLVSYAQSLQSKGGGDSGTELVPWDVTQSVQQRVGALSPLAQRLLQAAAVVGRRVPRRLLLAVVRESQEEVLDALDEVCAARLLIEDGALGYQFAHDVIAEVIEAGLSAGRRAALHGQVARAIERLPSPDHPGQASELAWHYELAEEPERALVHTLRAAEEAAAVFAHGQAEAHYRRAVELAQQIGDAVAEVEALEKRGRVLVVAGRTDEAVTALEAAATLYCQAGDQEAEARTVAELGEVHYARGTRDEGTRRVQAVLAAQQHRAPSRGLAALYGAAARLYWQAQQMDEVLAMAGRELELASAVKDRKAVAHAQRLRGMALRELGHWNEARHALQEALQVAREVGDAEDLFATLSAVAQTAFFACDFHATKAQLLGDLAVIERMANSGWLALALAFLGRSCFCLGEWQDARISLERAVTVGNATDALWYRAFPALYLAELSTAEGAWEQATRWLEEGSALADRLEDRQVRDVAIGFWAELDLLRGAPADALTRFAPRLRDGTIADREVVGDTLVPYAWAHLELGEIDRADAIVRRESRQPAARSTGQARLSWRWMAGKVLARQERWEDAQAAFESVATRSRQVGFAYMEARARYDWGRMLVVQGEHTAARQQLAEAQIGFARLGAGPCLHWTEKALRALR